MDCKNETREATFRLFSPKKTTCCLEEEEGSTKNRFLEFTVMAVSKKENLHLNLRFDLSN
jgi:hypothetical protein